jgi:hypothetical protein
MLGGAGDFGLRNPAQFRRRQLGSAFRPSFGAGKLGSGLRPSYGADEKGFEKDSSVEKDLLRFFIVALIMIEITCSRFRLSLLLSLSTLNSHSLAHQIDKSHLLSQQKQFYKDPCTN